MYSIHVQLKYTIAGDSSFQRASLFPSANLVNTRNGILKLTVLLYRYKVFKINLEEHYPGNYSPFQLCSFATVKLIPRQQLTRDAFRMHSKLEHFGSFR